MLDAGVRTWTQEDLIGLIEHHNQVVEQNRAIKREIYRLILRIVNFEVKDLEPVVEEMTTWLNRLD